MMASPFDDSAVLDQTTPWAPTTPLAPVPTAAPAQPKPTAGKITPETHPQYFNAPKGMTGKLEEEKPAQTAPPAQPAQSGASDYMTIVRRRESGGNDFAGNGTAYGRYQFTPQTWLGVAAAHPELGLKPEDIWNGEKQDQAMRALTSDNAKVLQENGLPETPANLYMLHFLGKGGGPKFLQALQANPNADAAAMFPLEAKYNSTIFFGQNGAPRTVGQIYGLMTKDFGGATVAPGETPASKPAAAADIPAADAVEAEEVLPPLPVGAKPIEAAKLPELKLPPLPEGAKPLTVQEAYKQDVGKNAYEEEANRNKPPGLFTKEGFFGPNASWSNLGGLIGPTPAPGHENDFSKAIYQAENKFGEQQGEFAEGVASGVAQAPIGIVENVPGPIGQEAAEADKALQQLGSSGGQTVGTTLAQAIPVGRGVEAAGAGMKTLLEEGPSFTNWAKTVLKGAQGAGLAAAMTPTGETDPEKRVKEKALDIATGVTSGAAFGGVAPTVGAAGKWLLNKVAQIPATVRHAFGGEAKKAAEELRSNVSSETGKALSAEEQKRNAALVEEGLKRVELAEHNAELERIEKARQSVAESERIRAEKGRDVAATDDPEAAARLRAQVSAQIRERVRDAERAARAAGQSEAEARGFAVEQEQKVAEAESEAKKLVDSYANQQNIDAKTFGRKIQETANETYEKYEKIRSEQSGFGKAIADAGTAPKVGTDPIKSYLDKAISETANPNTKAIFRQVRDEITTKIQTADGSKTVNGLSVRKADSLRKTLESAIRTKQMTVANNAAADASEARYHLAKIRGMLVNSARTASPEYGQALNRFRELSRPLDIFERKGALRPVVEKDSMSGAYKMDQARVVGAILAKTKGASPALSRLISENPELKDSARLYFNHELFGFENAPKTPTVKDFNNFFRNNEEALKQSGLEKEFVDLKSARASGEEAIKRAKEDLGAAEKTAQSAQDVRRETLDKVASERSLLKGAAKREEQTAKGLTTPEDIAKSAATRAKEAEMRLKEQAKGPEAKKSETKSSIEELAGKQSQAEAARRDFKQFQSSIDTLPTKNVATAAGSAIEKLHARGHLSDAQLDKFNRQIEDVNKRYGDKKEAREALVKILITAGGLSAAGGYGVPLIRHTLPLH